MQQIAHRSLDLMFFPSFDGFWRRRLRGKVLCLQYNRVEEPGQFPFLDRYGPPPIPPGELLRELGFLANHGASFLTLSDLRRDRFPGPGQFGVVVCFDQCFRSNYSAGLGVIEWLSAKGVLFQASGMVDAPSLIWEHTLYWLAHDPDRAEVLQQLAHGRLPASRPHTGDALVAHLSGAVPMATVEELLAEAIAKIGAGANERLAELAQTLYPSAAYLKAARANGHEIASQGHHHYPRQAIDAEAFEQELIRSQQELEAIVGRKPQAFAYPFNNYGPDDAELAGRHYYQVGTMEARPITADTPRLALPRCRWPGPFPNTRQRRRWLLTGHI
jgi:peptidoglycan/xylan/chitin deacetylase (PgdA/CDA1 family)